MDFHILGLLGIIVSQFSCLLLNTTKYTILLLISFSILSATYWASDAVIPESPAGSRGAGVEVYMDLTITFFVFIGYFSSMLYYILLYYCCNQSVKLVFVPNKFFFSTKCEADALSG